MVCGCILLSCYTKRKEISVCCYYSLVILSFLVTDFTPPHISAWENIIMLTLLTYSARWGWRCQNLKEKYWIRILSNSFPDIICRRCSQMCCPMAMPLLAGGLYPACWSSFCFPSFFQSGEAHLEQYMLPPWYFVLLLLLLHRFYEYSRILTRQYVILLYRYVLCNPEAIFVNLLFLALLWIKLHITIKILLYKW